MANRLTTIAIDCHDPETLAAFWAEVLGYVIVETTDDEVEIAAAEPTVEAVRSGPMPPTLLFMRVPDDKVTKNRLHLDLSPIDRSRDDEVERILALGARHVDIGQGERSWVVLADPEGNEFCVLRTLAPDSEPRATDDAQG